MGGTATDPHEVVNLGRGGSDRVTVGRYGMTQIPGASSADDPFSGGRHAYVSQGRSIPMAGMIRAVRRPFRNIGDFRPCVQAPPPPPAFRGCLVRSGSGDSGSSPP